MNSNMPSTYSIKRHFSCIKVFIRSVILNYINFSSFISRVCSRGDLLHVLFRRLSLVCHSFIFLFTFPHKVLSSLSTREKKKEGFTVPHFSFVWLNTFYMHTSIHSFVRSKSFPHSFGLVRWKLLCGFRPIKAD